MLKTILNKIKWGIRSTVVSLEEWSEKLIVPKDLWDRIDNAKFDKDELVKIYSEINSAREKFPQENEFIRAQAIIERFIALNFKGESND